MTAPPLCVETDLALTQTAVNGLAWRRPPHAHAVLRWDPCDPWAVTLDFHDGPTWVFGWDLLADGAAGQFCAGTHDVRIWRGERVTRIVLSSPDGRATFEVDAWDLAAFVDAVRPRQAANTWRTGAALTAELRALLDGAR